LKRKDEYARIEVAGGKTIMYLKHPE